MENKTKFRFLKLILFSLVLIMQSKSGNSIYESCRNRIFDEERLLSSYEITSLCSFIEDFNTKQAYGRHSTNVDFLLRIVSDLPNYNERGYDSLYDNDNEDFTNFQTGRLNIREYNTICLTVYYNARRIRLSVGKNLSSIVDERERERVIDSMKPYLKNKEYYKAFSFALMGITSSLGSSFNNHHSNHHNSNRNHHSQSNHNYNNNHYSSNNENESNKSSSFIWIVVFIIIIFFVVFLSSSNKIHEHFKKLNDLIKTDIYKNTPPIGLTTKCLICMNELNRSDVQSITDKRIECFSCGHYYHKSCIESMSNSTDAKKYCMMCDEPTANIQTIECEENLKGIALKNVVTEKNVVNIINNFNKIYGEEELKKYYSSYETQDIKIINSYSTSVWWLTNSFYIPVRTTTSKNYKTSGVSYAAGASKSKCETSGGSWDDDNKRSGNYKTSGGDY